MTPLFHQRFIRWQRPDYVSSRSVMPMDYLSHLVCCICRVPFTDPVTTRSCAHTFCRHCITEALSHSPQCPIDRLPLSLDDLQPADPIVRSLLDELVVECPNQQLGCAHTCQRQLLATHITGCLFAEHPCSQCQQPVLRKDEVKHRCSNSPTPCDMCGVEMKSTELDDHRMECMDQQASCTFCDEGLPRSDLAAHHASCPLYTLTCLQIGNGCPWSGPRKDMESHAAACPYHALSGFFAIHNQRSATLTEENIVLRQQIYGLEGVTHDLRTELNRAKSALGPWYHNPVSKPSIRRNSDSVTDQSAGWLRNLPSTFDIDSGFPSPQFFPPESLETVDPIPPHHQRVSFSGWERPAATQNSVAPLNLTTSLEGTLVELRESVVSLGLSMESLGRRHDIALTNEVMRMNEELGSLRAGIHGLRMQVHGIMLDRNAQAINRLPGAEIAQGAPISARLSMNPPSITKL